MSKMDDLRAMREARYAESAARAGTSRATSKRPAKPAPEPVVAQRPAADPEPPEASLCGHRAISGRTCTREKGHAAKSHRYS
ncbi:hypothetical protein GCM10009844_37890 [Nocardioides koreensis]|uniref:Uncharacterized protein n=1 Tax=Nocardioides koreensis TaxID=433651 RepID=A0ABP5LTJ8_9ACTN